jgi:hypothetical protein
VAVLKLLSRRSRQRDNDFLEDCSDDDLMNWGRELSDDEEPLFADRLPRPPAPIVEPVSVLALPLPGAFELTFRRRSGPGRRQVTPSGAARRG